jgi:hypothetical protein
MFPTIAAAALLLSAATAGDALARSADITSGLFLGYNETQQSIYVQGLMDGEGELINKCAPDKTAEQMTEKFIAFVNAHPQYMQRPANLAFREMLARHCTSKQ